jgi:3-hydroxyisobutyrate dehydrogenase-like beta-hydroxyacid dehydrogenase
MVQAEASMAAQRTGSVAFVGLGQMGRQMAQRLGGAGFALRVWNRTRSRAEGLPGAQVFDTPREAAAGADLVVSSLADDQAVRQVVLGADGLLAGLPAGGVHLGTSTISLRLCGELADAHAGRGQAFVAAPVLGRPDAAGRGELWILTGGDEAAIARAAPVLARLGQGQVHVGTPPQAALAKILANFMIAGTIELLAEATTLGEKGGIAPPALIDLFTRTLFGSPIVKGYGARIAAGQFRPAGFPVPLGLKDVELALEAARDLRAPLPTAGVARDHLIGALARGRADWDWGALATVVREMAGLDVPG